MVERRVHVESKKKSRWWLWVLLAIVVLGGGWFASRQLFANESQGADAADGEIVTAFIGDLSSVTSASGQLVPQREATLSLGIAGQVQSVLVQVGDEVTAGDLLVQLDADALQRAVRTAEQNLAIQEANLAELRTGASDEDVAAAEASLTSAQAQLNDLLDGPTEEDVAAAEANLRAAQASVWGAAEQRDQVAVGATDAEIASAEAQVVQAELAWKQARDAHDATMKCVTLPDGEEVCPALGPMEEQARYNLAAAEKNLEAAQDQLEQLQAGADQNQLGAAQANVNTAAAQRDAAQAQLDLLQRGSTEAQVAAAQAQVAQAEASFASLQKGASEHQITIAEAQVEQARINLEEAQDNLANASLTAPFDGVVTAVLVTEGEWVSGPAVNLQDTSSLEVVLEVDEVDIGAIAVGQEASVTLETWPDDELSGQVISIAPKAQQVQEIVVYEVHLVIDSGNLAVRAGMTANASLVTANIQDVLLVPNRAITADREAGKYYVNLVQDGQVSQEEVAVGLRDSNYTRITDGLSEGDEVMIGDFREVLDFTSGPPRGMQGMGQ
jgi:HlyD family secretion protein